MACPSGAANGTSVEPSALACRTIPFTLVGANARTPKNDRDDVLARQKEAERPPAWPGPHPDQG